jgi:hypothetical protein
MEAQAADLAPFRKDEATMADEEATVSTSAIGTKGWMLMWACVAVFGVACVWAAVLN